ncbi:transcription elongation factor Elf1 like-domain-containing protein [Rhodotorula diobovata]|uniref:Transcription elongation factor 1 homolog n=1 Tax=Rhodotorula diobovata TaxID=5288 RepID=A0A5C5FPK4_9BASI|nr:transcription elongation factor Elf1 like-domain-containing protein [Rhodotorula diobovata]
MGKRKSSKKPQARIKQVLDKSFRCVFCAHQGSVTCKLDNKTKIGRLDCKDCGQSFQTDITHLSEPVDLYSQWIDACEEANPVGQPAPRAKSATAQPSAQKKKRRADEDEDEGSEEDRDFEEGVDPAAGGDEGEEDEEELPDLRPKGRKKQRVDSPEEDEEE